MLIGNNFFFYQFNDVIGEYFGVDIQFFMVFYGSQCGIGDGINVYLQGGVIFNEVGDMLINVFFDIGRFRQGNLWECIVYFCYLVEFVDMNNVIIVGVWYVRVDFCNYGFSGLCSGKVGIYGYVECVEIIFIWSRDLQYCYI